jgi:hypothetical protein
VIKILLKTHLLKFIVGPNSFTNAVIKTKRHSSQKASAATTISTTAGAEATEVDDKKGKAPRKTHSYHDYDGIFITYITTRHLRKCRSSHTASAATIITPTAGAGATKRKGPKNFVQYRVPTHSYHNYDCFFITDITTQQKKLVTGQSRVFLIQGIYFACD